MAAMAISLAIFEWVCIVFHFPWLQLILQVIGYQSDRNNGSFVTKLCEQMPARHVQMSGTCLCG
jgi:hypothetical protein